MGHADRIPALARGARQAVIAGITVELQDPVKALQEGLRVLSAAPGRIKIDNARRVGAVPPAIIASQRPEIPGLGPTAPGIEDRRCVLRGLRGRIGGHGPLRTVHEQLCRPLQVLGQSVDNGPQVERGNADPVGQGGAMDVDAGPGEDLALPV
jgi:hypothetical protein